MNRRILIVDDNTALRNFLRLLLVCAGYAVYDAANGRDALRIMAQEPIDLVITDLIMPEMEGLETIFAIRRSQPYLPIIAMSGGGMISAQSHLHVARKAGVARLLMKPFENTELLCAVDQLLCAGAAPSGQTIS
jgi:CheY-like chemotaxis protein